MMFSTWKTGAATIVAEPNQSTQFFSWSQRNSSHLWMVQLPVHKSVQSLSSSQRGRLGATFLTSGQVGRLEPGL
jgi:hypothetical protein